MLAVTGKHEVLRGEGSAGADLRGLLAVAGRPQAQLTLALQRNALAVDTTQHEHVAVQVEQGLVVDVGEERVEVGIRHACAVRTEDAFDHFEIVFGVDDGGGVR